MAGLVVILQDRPSVYFAPLAALAAGADVLDELDEPPPDDPPPSFDPPESPPGEDDEDEEDDEPLLELPSFFPGFTEEYRSAYQPPPFRMKRPPLICRRAVACWHFGQISSGGSEIFWISSQ